MRINMGSGMVDIDTGAQGPNSWQQEGFPSKEEKTAVEQWIERHNLNQFGDPMSTRYAGGNPLYYSGKTRYEYILSQNPEKPWALMIESSSNNLSEGSGSLRGIADEVRAEGDDGSDDVRSSEQ